MPAICGLPNFKRIAGSLAIVCVAQATMASELCGQLEDLRDAARSNFENELSPENPLGGAQECGLSRTLTGANALHCAKEFSYRDPIAKATFEGLTGSIATCIGKAAPQDAQTVNHPDSYDQRVFLADDIAVSLALKDKGALQKTYIFLNIEGAPSE